MPAFAFALGAVAGWVWGPNLLDSAGVAQDMSRQNQQIAAAAAFGLVAYMAGDRFY